MTLLLILGALALVTLASGAFLYELDPDAARREMAASFHNPEGKPFEE